MPLRKMQSKMKPAINNIEHDIAFWAHMLDESSNRVDLCEAKMSRDQREQFDAQLRQGTVEFDYYKKEKDANGQPTGNLVRRHAVGTLNPNLMPSEQEQRRIASANNIDYDFVTQERERRLSYMVPYWDLEAGQNGGWGWRQFHVSRFIETTSSTPYNGGNTQAQRNNVFIHTNRVENSQITPELATTINSTLRGISQTIASANAGDGNVFMTFQMQNNIPTLIYNYDVETSQADLANFRLTIEDVVRQIFQQHGVLIEKIKADVEITWN